MARLIGIFNSVLLLLISIFFASSLLAQPGYYFGQNKVHYKDFDWSVFRTEHFDVHYYSEAEQAAYDAARMAERAYDYLSEVLDHQIEKRIPLILYASLNDFQQTNVVQGLIGDGTRGVTESLKNRVVLPITGSYRELNHVLVHELVHAFQFDIMFNRQPDLKLARFNPPLWFVEGMAEYLSIGMDNITRMWVRDGLLYDNLLTVEQLNGTFDIRVYRLGESLWHFIGEEYGKKMVGQIFKFATASGSIEKALQNKIGMNFKELTTAWHEEMKKQVLPADSTLPTAEQIAVQITQQENYFHRMNILPAVSPDGKSIAYVANKNLHDEIYLITENEDGTIKHKRIVKGGQSKNFEALRFFDSSISWSDDGKRIAFVSKSGKHDAIFIMNPFEEEVLQKLIFERLNGLLSPNFSPGGKRLVFVGLSGGISNLYIINLNDKNLTQLTDDQYAELHPSWSPDGKNIAFITDKGEGTHREELLFGDYDLALHEIESGEIEIITQIDGDAINPQWSADGKEIAFISDHQGIQNIYRVNVSSEEILPVTTLKNAVAGITTTTPAFSWSADGKTIVFSSFVKGGWQLFRINVDKSNAYVAQLDQSAINSAIESEEDKALLPDENEGIWLPEIPDQNSALSDHELEHTDSIEARDYSNKLRLDGVFLGATFGGFLGTVGGAQFQFSDMLGNHNLVVSTGLRFDIHNSDIGLAYLNQADRLNWGAEIFQLKDAYGAFIARNALGVIRQTYRGFNTFAFYPFSRFSRIELNAGIAQIKEQLVVESFQNGEEVEDKFDIGEATFGQVGAALVFDNTIYGPLGPLSGRRSRFSIQTAVNDFEFTSFIGDYRKYFNIKNRSVLALRLMGGASTGQDAQFFRIGGPYTFRGTSSSDLIGPYFIMENLEFRFPMLPFLPPTADVLSGVTFVDAAAAWGIDIPGFSKEKFQPFTTESGFRLNDLRSAIGVGARLNIGFIGLRFDLAWPTNLQNFGEPVKLFSIGSYF